MQENGTCKCSFHLITDLHKIKSTMKSTNGCMEHEYSVWSMQLPWNIWISLLPVISHKWYFLSLQGILNFKCKGLKRERDLIDLLQYNLMSTGSSFYNKTSVYCSRYTWSPNRVHPTSNIWSPARENKQVFRGADKSLWRFFKARYTGQ